MTTSTPVTTSGFYPETDGGYRYYWWRDGQVQAGHHVFASLALARIVQTVEQLAYLSAPSYLHALGYTDTDIRRAVRANALRWQSDGRLTPTHGTR